MPLAVIYLLYHLSILLASHFNLFYCFIVDYYLLDGGSILPVLALDIQLGDFVLDMCAAPGGKTLTILQTLMPNLVVANDLSQSRINRIKKVLNQYIADIGQLDDRLFITEEDARKINDKDVYNKVLYIV